MGGNAIHLACLAGLVSILLLAADNPAGPWRSSGNVTLRADGDALFLASSGGEYGKCAQTVDLPEGGPNKWKVSFLARHEPGTRADATFSFSVNFSLAPGSPPARNPYWKIGAATNGPRPARFYFEIPPGARRMELCFQPQGPIGGRFPASAVEVRAFLLSEDALPAETLALLSKPLTRSAKPKAWPTGGLRGFNMDHVVAPMSANSQNPGAFVSDATFQQLAAWNVNVLRLWVSVDEGTPWARTKRGEAPPPIPADDPMAPYREHLRGLTVALHLAEKYGIQIILTVSDIVGRRIDVMYAAGDGGGFEKELTRVWTVLAREFGSHPNLLGFDLLNEPNGKEEARWTKETLPALVKTVRAIDTNTYLVIEPSPWALPWGFESFRPIADAKVAYSLHHYMPHTYTHQGIGGYDKPEYRGKAYPGLLKKFPSDPPMYWGKAQLEETLLAAAAFQKASGAPMFVGEFSAARWAPGAAAWVRDSIELFEKYGMDWVFHCYWGWNGWNPTFDADETPSNDSDGGKLTDRIAVLLEAWAKNRR